VEGDPDWPVELKVWPPNKGCVRRKAAAEWFYHPERVNFPLKRAGEKGGGKWQKITWEQALDEIAGKLKQIKDKYGGEAISLVMGTGRTEIPPINRLFDLLGAPNSCRQGQICFFPRAKVADAITGYYHLFSVKPTTKCIVAYGVEPMVARPITAQAINIARKNGAKLIVIDPRRTRSASMADIWLQIRPGTDTALMLGMANVIIAENLYDKEFVDKWCYGFEELKKLVKEYNPQKVAQITNLPADLIIKAARLYAANRPACFVEGLGVENQQGNARAFHARWVLSGLTGNIGVEGGDEQAGPYPEIRPAGAVEPIVTMSPEQSAKQLGASRFKLFTAGSLGLQAPYARKVWDTMPMPVVTAHAPMVYRAAITGKPFPIKAMMCFGANPMITQSNVKMVHQALKSLDLLVVSDFWLTPTAELGDYVLPVASWLERPIIDDSCGYGRFLTSGEAALPASIYGEYEHKTDYDIIRELAIRLGYEKYFPWENLEKYYDYLLEPTGFTHQQFVEQVRVKTKVPQYKRYEDLGFATPTGKIEFHSTVFEKLGYDPLPKYVEPAETEISEPELAKKYPLRLITGGKVRERYHSEWHHVESVRKLHPDPLLQIHPETAASLDIKDGDWVWIETLRGRVRQRAKLFDGILPNVVHAEHGWWLPELPGEEPCLHGVWEMNINVCMNDDPDVCDEITGSWPLKTALCKVYICKRI
jgi:anaerobic selenocysteine-containing dehydrogenase